MAKKTKADPSGQRVNRKNAARAIDRRLDKAQRSILRWLRELPKTRKTQTKIRNANDGLQVVYSYETDAEQVALMVQANIDAALVTAAVLAPVNHWWYPYVDLPYRQGALEELNEFNRIVSQESARQADLALRPIPETELLFSKGYTDGMRQFNVRDYGIIKSLSDRTAYQVTLEIQSGVEAGLTPTEISQQIQDRFGVAKSNAERIARTEVNWGYNQARLNTLDQAKQATGVNVAVMHISSLIQTTRPSHAARHGRVYTVAQQQAWWASGDGGTASINCLCSVRSVLIKNGKVVDQELQKRIKGELPEEFR